MKNLKCQIYRRYMAKNKLFDEKKHVADPTHPLVRTQKLYNRMTTAVDSAVSSKSAPSVLTKKFESIKKEAKNIKNSAYTNRIDRRMATSLEKRATALVKKFKRK